MAKRTKRATARKTKSKGGKARSRALDKRATKRAAPKRARKTIKKTPRKAGSSGVISQTRVRPQKQILEPAARAIETTIVDVIEEPVPGVVTVTEFEAERIVLPDSDDENED